MGFLAGALTATVVLCVAFGFLCPTFDRPRFTGKLTDPKVATGFVALMHAGRALLASFDVWVPDQTQMILVEGFLAIAAGFLAALFNATPAAGEGEPT